MFLGTGEAQEGTASSIQVSFLQGKNLNDCQTWASQLCFSNMNKIMLYRTVFQILLMLKAMIYPCFEVL